MEDDRILLVRHRKPGAYDFWVASDVDVCDTVVVGNPNVAGSALYRDVARYAILFSNFWDGRRQTVVRQAIVQPLATATPGGIQVEGRFAWNGGEGEAVPVNAWQRDRGAASAATAESPFLRISIVHPSSMYLGAYDRVTLQCR